MPEHAKHQDHDAEDAKQDAPAADDPSTDGGDPTVDHQTQFGGVTIDPDKPNDEG